MALLWSLASSWHQRDGVVFGRICNARRRDVRACCAVRLYGTNGSARIETRRRSQLALRVLCDHVRSWPWKNHTLVVNEEKDGSNFFRGIPAKTKRGKKGFFQAKVEKYGSRKDERGKPKFMVAHGSPLFLYEPKEWPIRRWSQLNSSIHDARECTT